MLAKLQETLGNDLGITEVVIFARFDVSCWGGQKRKWASISRRPF
jgi:hypothetical protein